MPPTKAEGSQAASWPSSARGQFQPSQANKKLQEDNLPHFFLAKVNALASSAIVSLLVADTLWDLFEIYSLTKIAEYSHFYPLSWTIHIVQERKEDKFAQLQFKHCTDNYLCMYV